MAKVTVCFLSYRDDSELVLESQRAAIKAFSKEPTLDVNYVLLDDAWCRTTKECREKFLAASDKASVLETPYRRGTMILGGENLTGQIEAFCDAAEAADADILVKMDADTCMFRADWIKEFAEDEKALCAGAFDFQNGNHTSVFGLCYALKRQILRPLLDDCRTYPAHHHAWEDHEVSSRVFRMAKGDMEALMRWRSNTNGDDFWVIPLSQANDTLVFARAANCAWDFSSQPADKKPAFRANVLAWMRKWNDAIDKGAK